MTRVRARKENLMAVFCAPTQQSSNSSSPVRWTPMAPFRVIVVVAALVLSGCNANKEVNLSSHIGPPVRSWFAPTPLMGERGCD